MFSIFFLAGFRLVFLPLGTLSPCMQGPQETRGSLSEEASAGCWHRGSESTLRRQLPSRLPPAPSRPPPRNRLKIYLVLFEQALSGWTPSFPSYKASYDPSPGKLLSLLTSFQMLQGGSTQYI